MADQLILPRAVDANDDPSAGALCYVFDAGTSTPKTTYSDTGLTTPHETPIEADGNGDFPAVFLSGTAKVTVTTAEGATLYTRDNFPTTSTTGGAAGQTSFNPITNNAASDVQEAIENNTNSIYSNVVIRRITRSIDASSLSTTSTSETVLSGIINYIPRSETSSVLVEYTAEWQTSAADDPRASIRLKNFDGTNYVGGNSVLIGGTNITPGSGDAQLFGTANDAMLYQVADRRPDTGAITVRLYGEASTAGVTVTIFTVRVTFTEYENVA